MPSKIEEQIGSLEERLRRLKQKKQRTEARTRSTSARRARRDELRRKVLVGAIVLARVERGELAQSELLAWLDGALDKAEDRALFGVGRSAALGESGCT